MKLAAIKPQRNITKLKPCAIVLITCNVTEEKMPILLDDLMLQKYDLQFGAIIFV